MNLEANQDWKPLSDIQGDEAAAKYAEIADADNEVAVECHYTGKNKMSIKLGKSSDGHGYGYVDDTESGKRLMTSSQSDIQTLFQSYVSFLCMRQSFVNSDPRSPDHFDIEPYLEDLVESLNGKFGISLQMDY